MPTSNARNSAMLKEAATFADHLKHCEKDIRTLKNASEGTATPLSLCVRQKLESCVRPGCQDNIFCLGTKPKDGPKMPQRKA